MPCLFRFFFWNDMHLRAPHVRPRHPGYPFCNEKGFWAAECARGLHGFKPPDFVLSGGDLIDGEIPDYRTDFEYLEASVLAGLRVPFLPCLGNHENGQGEGIPERNRAYDACFGPLWHNYLFTCRGIGFIVLDTSGAHRQPDEVTAARNAFLQRAFDRLAGWPKILVTHVPLVPMREERVLKASFGFSSWRVLDERLLERVGEHADTILAVLSGHIHLTSVRRCNGICHIMPAGLGGYPSAFADLEVYPDRMAVRMQAAPDRWLDSRGNIHGKPRHPEDFTDMDHPDPESYVWGNPDERSLVVPLEGGRSPRSDSLSEPLRVFHEARPGCWEEAAAPALV